MNVFCSVGNGETRGEREESDDSAVIALEAVSYLSAGGHFIESSVAHRR